MTTKVTPAMLNDAANTATQVGEGIAAELTRVLAAVEETQSGFQGLAGDSFQSVSTQLGNELRQILDALNKMADDVQGSNAAYGSTDADANQEIKNVVHQYEPGNMPVANALRGN